MSELLEALLRTSLLLALAVAMLALMRPLQLRLGGPLLVYRAWWLVALLPLVQWLPAPTSTVAAQMPLLVVEGMRWASPQVPAADASWHLPVLLVWGAGALLMAVRAWRAQARFRMMLGPLKRRGDGTWQASGDPGLPALVGLWRPRIVVGPDFDTCFSPAERDLILQHERMHLANGDHVANVLLCVFQVLFWFHPLQAWAARRFRRDQELACDARTVDPHPALRRLYASALLKAQLASSSAPATCHWRLHHPLKERIAMLKQAKSGVVRNVCGQAVLLGGCLSVAAIAWAGGQSGDSATAINAEAFAWVTPEASTAAGAVSTDAVVENMVPPAYPAQAEQQRIGGEVVLRVTVEPDGRTSNVRVLSSTPVGVFDEVSIAAARGWTFQPATRDGKPVASDLRVPLTFEMDDVQ